jgi:hypothetical protein
MGCSHFPGWGGSVFTFLGSAKDATQMQDEDFRRNAEARNLKALSSVVHCLFEGGNPRGAISGRLDHRSAGVSTGRLAILEANTGAPGV